MVLTPRLEPPDVFGQACATIGLELTDAELGRLGRYLHLLLETNRQFNLTAITDPGQAWRRHILDSLSLLPFIDASGPLIDVGSGGGLPGVPLAIARPQLPITLLEATGKKARFLERVVDDLGLTRVTVVSARAEEAGRQQTHRQRYATAVARAVGPMRVLLEYALPLVREGGRVLAMKGRRVEAELDESGDALLELGGGAVELYEALPGLEDEAVIVEVRKAGPTPPPYPRRPGEPKANPL